MRSAGPGMASSVSTLPESVLKSWMLEFSVATCALSLPLPAQGTALISLCSLKNSVSPALLRARLHSLRKSPALLGHGFPVYGKSPALLGHGFTVYGKSPSCLRARVHPCRKRCIAIGALAPEVR